MRYQQVNAGTHCKETKDCPYYEICRLDVESGLCMWGCDDLHYCRFSLSKCFSAREKMFYPFFKPSAKIRSALKHLGKREDAYTNSGYRFDDEHGANKERPSEQVNVSTY